ncbi:hypothetical protein DFH09DRAFT_1098585 [Mycena vulgaris]|nr:hypothetical protein DFH09DRAFT_1098585 [Mycena vulgaris]
MPSAASPSVSQSQPHPREMEINEEECLLDLEDADSLLEHISSKNGQGKHYQWNSHWTRTDHQTLLHVPSSRNTQWDAKRVDEQTPREIAAFITQKCGPVEQGLCSQGAIMQNQPLTASILSRPLSKDLQELGYASWALYGTHSFRRDMVAAWGGWTQVEAITMYDTEDLPCVQNGAFTTAYLKTHAQSVSTPYAHGYEADLLFHWNCDQMFRSIASDYDICPWVHIQTKERTAEEMIGQADKRGGDLTVKNGRAGQGDAQ